MMGRFDHPTLKPSTMARRYVFNELAAVLAEHIDAAYFIDESMDHADIVRVQKAQTRLLRWMKSKARGAP